MSWIAGNHALIPLARCRFGRLRPAQALALLRFYDLRRAICFGRDNICDISNAVRRLASPVRVTLAFELGGDLDGAWWPHTAWVAHELAELTDALFTRLGRIIDSSVNWSSLAGSPDFDSLNRPRIVNPGRAISHERLMTITGDKAPAKLMVIPSRTSSALAVMVLRRAADLPVAHAERKTEPFLTCDQIVRAARAESTRSARRLLEHDRHILAPQIEPLKLDTLATPEMATRRVAAGRMRRDRFHSSTMGRRQSSCTLRGWPL